MLRLQNESVNGTDIIFLRILIEENCILYIKSALAFVYRSVEYLNELDDQQKGIEYFETMIRYLLGAKTKLTQNDMKEMFDKIGNTFLEGSELSMSLADILREEGMEIGLKKGKEEGRIEGMQMSLAEIANQWLVAKFKKVPPEISNGIEELSIPVLKEIVSKIMRDEGFNSLDEVREYL